MCYPFKKVYTPDLLSVLPPYGVPPGIMTFAPLTGKIVELRGGNHISSKGMIYDIRQVVNDNNAIINDHDNCIHLAPSPDERIMSEAGMSSYGSHLLATVPGKHLWGTDQADNTRCWHTNSGFPVVCLTCEGITPEILGLQEFQQDMKMAPLNLPPGMKIVGYDPIKQEFSKVDSDQPVDPSVLQSFYRSLN